ncbi:hypothetical protein E4U13_003506 [Claviceps humidiphila]|uniref:Phosphatidylinositol transfer protein SFH5 n=1 Tax=Claviceps humidiphila TaxID=1294629 RepID=A0A9P7Q0E1_9HYPO|nr:hypothetical protein E4U13_003506 [Claviceps humidiphila]
MASEEMIAPAAAAEQAPAAPAADVAPETPAAPAAPAVETPLTKLTARLSDITNKAKHSEMWGVELSPSSAHAPTQVVLLKFLRANNNQVDAAEKQLLSALEWRKEMQPAKLVTEAFPRAKFGDLGYVTTHKDAAGKETVITWNIYGAVKNNKTTFGNVQEFLRWRTALMELGVQKLNLNDITKPLAEDDEDIYRMLQVHDYLSVSFFRMDPAVKTASKQTIQTFSMAYPELLSHKYFVNVPAIMGWMFGFMKLFLAPATLRKFHPMTSGTSLSTELKSLVASLPKEYGGQGPSVKEAETVYLVDEAVAAPQEMEGQTAAVTDTAAPTNPDVAQPEAQPVEAAAVETKPAAEIVVAAVAPGVGTDGEAKPAAPLPKETAA